MFGARPVPQPGSEPLLNLGRVRLRIPASQVLPHEVDPCFMQVEGEAEPLGHELLTGAFHAPILAPVR